MMTLEQYLKKIPDFKGANWLLRVPLGVIFILQGLQKLPLDVSPPTTTSAIIPKPLCGVH